MPSATVTRAAETRARLISRWFVWLPVALAFVIATFASSHALRGPKFISRISFANSSPYALDVEVASAGRDDWMQVGTMAPNATSSAELIVDQGRRWAFRIRAQGVSGGQFVIERTALVQSGWLVAFPQAVIDRLQGQHISVTPTD